MKAENVKEAAELVRARDDLIEVRASLTARPSLKGSLTVGKYNRTERVIDEEISDAILPCEAARVAAVAAYEWICNRLTELGVE